MYDTEGVWSPQGERLRFNHVRAGPARTLQALLHALRRGDSLVALSGSVRCERHAILAQAERLAGRYLSRTIWLNAGEVGSALPMHLDRSSLIAGRGVQIALFAPWQTRRTLLIVDEAELLDSCACNLLCHVHDARSGNPVQVLIAGGTTLIPRLCRLEFADVWRQTGAAITLESAAPVVAGEMAALREEIDRAEARLKAKRRILAIFASDGGASTSSAMES